MNTINLFPATPAAAAPEVKVAEQVRSLGQHAAQVLLNNYVTAYNLVWNNPNATPDKVIVALGVSAAAVFAHSAELVTFLTTLGATGIPTTVPAGWTLTTNSDGSMVATKA